MKGNVPLIGLFTLFAIGCQTTGQIRSTSTNVYQHPSQFSVAMECVSWLPDEPSICNGYNVIKTNIDGTSEILMDDYSKQPIIEQLSKNLYQVTYSCGNYCRANEFWSATDSDGTDRLIAFNPQNHCLIEYDFDNNDNTPIFTARKLYSQDTKIIYTGIDMYESAVIDSVVHSAEFVGDDLQMQLLDKNWKNINIIINDVCQ